MLTERVYVVIPILNEEGNIPRLIEDLRTTARKLDFEFHFILIDDGSTDHSVEVAKANSPDLDFIILRHDRNRGVLKV